MSASSDARLGSHSHTLSVDESAVHYAWDQASAPFVQFESDAQWLIDVLAELDQTQWREAHGLLHRLHLTRTCLIQVVAETGTAPVVGLSIGLTDHHFLNDVMGLEQ